jgi:hypothetical protein
MTTAAMMKRPALHGKQKRRDGPSEWSVASAVAGIGPDELAPPLSSHDPFGLQTLCRFTASKAGIYKFSMVGKLHAPDEANPKDIPY